MGYAGGVVVCSRTLDLINIMELTKFSRLLPNSKRLILLASVAVSAGEPLEIPDDFERIDLNEYLTDGNDGIFLIRAVGDSMECEIYQGDLLVINRNLQARNGDKIIASVNGACIVKIFSQSPHGLRLVASNGKYQPHEICVQDNFQIFGVVTHIVRNLKKN